MKIGDVVEIAPHYDMWMRGARTGRIVRQAPIISKKKGKLHYWVQLEYQGRNVGKPGCFPAEDLTVR